MVNCIELITKVSIFDSSVKCYNNILLFNYIEILWKYLLMKTYTQNGSYPSWRPHMVKYFRESTS